MNSTSQLSLELEHWNGRSIARCLAEHTVKHTADGEPDSLSARVRSLGRPETAQHLSTVIQKQVVEPLTAHVSGANAPAVAAFVASQMLGATIAISVLGLPSIDNLDTETLVDLLEDHFDASLRQGRRRSLLRT